jgi:hypothetical protein
MGQEVDRVLAGQLAARLASTQGGPYRFDDDRFTHNQPP